ncbi:hypothetical protein NL676_029826 [Syzygium grande]|nr:hypothetical protein NL676_029826 [Syzygium grande]
MEARTGTRSLISPTSILDNELLEQIQAVQSLQRLEIYDCPSLTSLPEGMQRLASLTLLTIIGCPELEEKCKRDGGGEDWNYQSRSRPFDHFNGLKSTIAPRLTSLPEGMRRLASLADLDIYECLELKRRLESLLNLNVTPYTDPIVANHIWIGGSGIDMGSKSSESTKRDQAWELKQEIIYGVRDTFSRDLPTVLAQSLWVVTLRSKEKVP